MKETRFIKTNQSKWEKFEKEKSRKDANPEELSKLYAEINSDLSYARTYYKNRTVRAYLNNLAQGLHRIIYKQKPITFNLIKKTWTVDIPISIYRSRKNLLIAFILFLVWALIGAISTHFNPDFANKVLGSHYISITEENLQAGNPMGVYGFSPQGIMFFEITLNNIKVALLAFFSGILFSIGTHIILFNNAVMVGVFQYFFKLKGLFLTSFLAIWIHGAFEISAIIVASGAGLTIGHGLLFPGSYTRFQSLQISARDGIRIMLSLIPVFILAGFLESFVTRNYLLLPDWSKFTVISISFLCIMFYYIFYPYRIAKKYPEKIHEKPSVKTLENISFKLFKLRKSIQIIKDSFHLYRILIGSIFKKYLKVVFPIVLIFMIFQNFIHADQMNVGYDYNWMAQLSILFGNYHSTVYKGWTDFFIGVFWVIPISFAFLIAFYHLLKQDKSIKIEKFNTFFKKHIFTILLPILVMLMLFIQLSLNYVWLTIFIMPFLMVWLSKNAFNEPTIKESSYMLASRNWSDGIGLTILISIFVIIAAQPIAFFLSFNDAITNEAVLPDFLDLFTGFLEKILASETKYAVFISNIIRQIVYLGFIFLMIPLLTLIFGLYFFHTVEREESISLKNRLKTFGEPKKDE